MCASLRFRVRERPEKYFLLSAWRRCPQYFIIWPTWIYKRNLQVNIFMLGVYATFSLFFKIWLTESIIILREQVFRVMYCLLASNTTSQAFSDENKQPSLEWHCIHFQGEIMGKSCRWVPNVAISILLKKGWFSFVRKSLKRDESQLTFTCSSQQ